ncbi:anti-sigma factor family protein [Streptomyces flavofungini]|uniref:anti-sigma factor family protein n=1 Tax=Streptomyces flavofungini TaxID=68200 RepID=UPI0025AFA9F2|nr:zf-HC2 domain-containing protein [Streptomyces flavofungini]WJV48405.1 zf-HC2 domain-containing protein [Streptomyces flavofungini]
MSTPYDAHGQGPWGPGSGFGGGSGSGSGPGDVHETVGAYALGILDDAEATEFEAHLAGCDFCAHQLEEFSGMAPMLAALADFPGADGGAGGGTGGPGVVGAVPSQAPAAHGLLRGVPQIGEQLATRPSPRLADRLVDEVAVKRAQRRRRGMYLVAAAAALIIGGPLAVFAVSDDDGGTKEVAGADPHPTSPAEDAFFNHMDDKIAATDPKTKVTATVGTEKKAWGTHTVLELKNVKGPLKCSLIAVGKDGKKETVTTWSVPQWGYGIKDSPHQASRNPLYVHGGAAFDRDDIDHFEVRTFDGERLVEVDV